MYKSIEKMISDLEIRERSKDTIKNMICSITSFSKYCDCPPENLGEKDIIRYLKYYINDRKLCRGTVNYYCLLTIFIWFLLYQSK